MSEPVTLSRQSLKDLLELYISASETLEKIPQMQDAGHFSQVAREIGEELQEGLTQINELEDRNQEITEVLEDINSAPRSDEYSLEELKEELVS